MQCTNNPTIPNSTSNSANPLSDSFTLSPGINSITPATIETTSQYSSPVIPNTTTTTTTAVTTTTTTTSDGDSLLNCPQCDRAFTSHIGLVSHFDSTVQRLANQRIDDNGIHRNADNTNTPCTPSSPAILTATATPTSMTDIPQASPDFSCKHCARDFNSRIGLVGHL
ncbi:unnamed protein product [Schistocephalus solidus]|uniref:C2H2-type domain-containing protein n=1 Tax=Schistocephalus solidus TaxID=70667 RepID=A0A183S8W8_SCHSO|nr:unnamed protein product [Schistocephalus solidus]